MIIITDEYKVFEGKQPAVTGLSVIGVLLTHEDTNVFRPDNFYLETCIMPRMNPEKPDDSLRQLILDVLCKHQRQHLVKNGQS